MPNLFLALENLTISLNFDPISRLRIKSYGSNRESIIILSFGILNINGNLAWKLKADQKFLKVNPGKFYVVTYTVENMISEEIIGQAIPSVTPQIASLYLKKSECFCFRNQVLKPGESKKLTVRFEVDKDIPKNVESLTLSYTFFRALKDDKKAS